MANADSHSLVAFKQNVNEPLYFHIDFVKPGKSTYFVYHDTDTTIGDEGMNFLDALGGLGLGASKKKDKQKSDPIYVHKMLAQFRQEDIITCKCITL